MKKIACEACGATDLIKQDGMFVCQFCGMKYSAEEIQKMVIEGPVDVSGSTVKVDNTDFLERCLQNARRAMQKEDWAEAEKYYNMAEQHDPKNIEAIFYSAYGKAKTSLVESDLYKRKAAFNVLKNCVSIIDDNFDIEREEENNEIIKKISSDIMGMACSSYVYNQRKNGYGVITWTDKNETETLFNTLGNEFLVTLENIANKYPAKDSKRVFYYTLALKHTEFILQHGNLTDPTYFKNITMTYHKWINQIDPTHEIPESTPEPVKDSSGGCYVATAVYGSYDCPQVWTLRRYRDYTLAETWYGRAFIRTYYAISPTLVKWFGHTDWFKNMWRGRLDRMVNSLRSKGVEDTPYDDKKW